MFAKQTLLREHLLRLRSKHYFESIYFVCEANITSRASTSFAKQTFQQKYLPSLPIEYSLNIYRLEAKSVE
ncbi:hypothetical protein I6N90_22600 [Paenibacillus sp. GSMTC-2017]|uniref:hypothetical protein n=1 Tax=Paenibacillus sp. GSMTC-2017 TaxID=2794350 RepID=UPI0018D704A6|nr:hypothetical protein [Paenibacillus sp. GSMTC-2017]MBH5320588.1 hypothetical protein [Paenibacillus sp. GSMTC-2017]